MRRRSGYIWLLAGAALAIIAGLLTVWVVTRVAPAAVPAAVVEPEIEVVVAARYIPVRELVLDDAVELRSVPARAVPDNALRSVGKVVGRMALIPLSPDEIILSNQLADVDVASGRVGFQMPDDRVAMVFSGSDLLSRSGLVQPGDHVDLLFSIDVAATEQEAVRVVTLNALQNVEIVGVVRPEAPTDEGVSAAVTRDQPPTFVVALDPQDALVLKHLWDIGGTVSLVLRAPGAEERFDVGSGGHGRQL